MTVSFSLFLFLFLDLDLALVPDHGNGSVGVGVHPIVIVYELVLENMDVRGRCIVDLNSYFHSRSNGTCW